MGLGFIYGPASATQEHALLEQAANWLTADKKNEVFYLVPNHVKFETEVNVLQNLHQLTTYQEWPDMATMRLQVFSFSRLAWYYLQQTAFYPKDNLSEAGRHMLLRKILLAQVENLQVFRGEVRKPGFIKQLADLFRELQDGNVQVEDLTDITSQLGFAPKEEDLKGKVADFQLLYQEYLFALVERDLLEDQLLTNLADYLAQQELSHVLFIISGFSRFTAREQQLIRVLMEKSSEVKINLVLDKSYPQEAPTKLELFHDSGKLYYEMYQLARSLNIKISQDIKVLPDPTKIATGLLALDQVWRQEKQSLRKDVLEVDNETVQVWQAETTYSEISHVAREIRRLVAEEHYRYKDIEILTRELGSYEALIPPIFEMNEVPFYLNQELEMRHHPFVEYIQSLFAIQQRNFRYPDVMRFLRTELFIPNQPENLSITDWQQTRNHYRNKVDITENVVLAYGYEGFYWTQSKDWSYIYYDFEADGFHEDENLRLQTVSNEVRNDLRNQLVPFFEKLKKAPTGKAAAILFYRFLIDSGVEEQLLFWRNQDIERNNLENARIHEQTWHAFIDLLDEYVAILGDQDFDLAEFIQIFISGLDGLSYSKVPTTIDQVSISSLDLVHASKNKITFIIGATDNVMPKKIENKTLLSDEERSVFSSTLEEGKFLIQNTTSDLAREPFIAYLAFQSASEKLYISFPAASDRTKDSKISPYVTRLVKELRLKVKNKTTQPSKDDSTDFIDFIGTYRTLISELTNLKRMTKEEYVSSPLFWQKLESRLLKQPQYVTLAEQIFASLTYKNVPEQLAPTIVHDLYGNTIYASVSKIESFYQCEYKYLMNYGLKLRERDVFGLSPAATGDFFHEALDQLFKVLIREQLKLSELNQEEVHHLTQEVLKGVLGESKFAILDASSRMNYIRYQLSKTIQRVSWALKKQSERTGMTTLQTEVLFGQLVQEQGLDSLNFDLATGQKLKIRGKIDRLDQLEIDQQEYLAVVDYKSSPHKFDFRDAYYGLAMQMITYLDIALHNAADLIGKKALPAGAFYLHVQNPLIEGKLSKEEKEAELLQEFTYQGLLIQDEKLLEQLDRTVEPKTKSFIYPFNQTAKGEMKSSQFVTTDEMDALIQHNQKNFKAAGEKIYEGQVALNPAYRDKQRIACGFCPFRSVCQFDPMLPENNYHRIDKLKKDEVMSKINPKKSEEEEIE